MMHTGPRCTYIRQVRPSRRAGCDSRGEPARVVTRLHLQPRSRGQRVSLHVDVFSFVFCAARVASVVRCVLLDA